MALSATPVAAVSTAQARRLLLAANGLLSLPPVATTASVGELVTQLGYVQIDSINVVERAHHLILAARLRAYRPSLIHHLLERQRRLFEHWTHDAAAIPVQWYPYWQYRFERYRRDIPRRAWWQSRIGADPAAVIGRVRSRLEREGPLMAKDFADDPDKGATGPWWGWSPAKTALEFLWSTGEVAIAGRRAFHKVYDLAARVLPEAAAAPRPAPEEHIAWASRTALERLGVATPEEIAAFWRAIPTADARGWCESAAARKEIAAVAMTLPDGSAPRAAFAVADWQERAAVEPNPGARMRLLCPFDPILRDRRRAQRLFGYEYRFEAFVPAAQRRHGYYTMPILEGEHLVGRVDPKLHRDRSLLTVQAVVWEPGVRPTRRRSAALDTAVGRLARLVGADRWELPLP